MKKGIFLLVLALMIVGLINNAYPAYEFEGGLEKPEWGMIEWNSATLPQGFWYATFEFLYAHSESYFAEGREVDFPGGRDSTAYIASAGMIYGVSNNLNLGILVPFMLDQKVDSGMFGQNIRIFSGAKNFGDVRLWAKYHFIYRYFWSLATEAGFTLPTGKPHNKVSADEAPTGDGQTDLNLALKGDILLTEESFVRLGGRFVYQFKRANSDKQGKSTDEKLGNLFGVDVGFAKNFKSMGFGGALQYNYWQATKVDDEVKTGPADLFNLFLQLSLGNLSPEKHGKIDLTLDFPLTGKNAVATYRLGISIKTIFR